MSKFFSLFKSEEKVVVEQPITRELFIKANEIFKSRLYAAGISLMLINSFLNDYSWLVYLSGGLMVLASIYYYIMDCKRHLNLRRRRENFQRANERPLQRRRPGAIYRDHEIFRNAIRTVRKYMGPKPLVLKKTPIICGSFSDME